MSYVYEPGSTPWTKRCHSEYKDFLKEYKPTLRCVTYLVFSGIRDAGVHPLAYYSEPKMITSYASAFQVHQRPFKTKALHVYFMGNMPYLIYLPVIAMPVDIVVHTLQFIIGENKFFFEGGIYFPFYMVLHWYLLFIAYCSIYVRFVPSLWNPYFKYLTKILVINDREYCRTLCVKRTALSRTLHFLTFAALVFMSCYYISSNGLLVPMKNILPVVGFVLVLLLAPLNISLFFGRLFVGMDCGKEVESKKKK